MSSGTKPNWNDAVKSALALTWADKMPDSLDSVVLSLGCTLTVDEKSLATSSLTSIEQGARTYRARVEAGEKTALVAVGAGYFDGAARGEFIEGILMKKYILEHPEVAGEISAKDVYVEPHSYNTPDNALDIGISLVGKNIGTFYLTSDPLHSKRALKTFKGVFALLGITAPIIAVPGNKPRYGNSNKWFLRSALTWRAWNIVGMTVLPGQLKAIEKALQEEGVLTPDQK